MKFDLFITVVICYVVGHNNIEVWYGTPKQAFLHLQALFN